MRIHKNLALQSSIVVGLILFLTMACSLTSKPDVPATETAISIAVEMTQAAINTQEASEAGLVVTDTPLPSDTLAPTNTFVPTVVVTRTPTASKTPWVTKTPEEMKISELKCGTKQNDDNEVTDPSKLFKAGTSRVVCSYHYQGIPNGAKVLFQWTISGKNMAMSPTITWKNPTSSSTARISSRAVYSSSGGLTKGNWSLTIYVNNQFMAATSFQIQ